jgi:hypothetical protein
MGVKFMQPSRGANLLLFLDILSSYEGYCTQDISEYFHAYPKLPSESRWNIMSGRGMKLFGYFNI